LKAKVAAAEEMRSVKYGDSRGKTSYFNLHYSMNISYWPFILAEGVNVLHELEAEIEGWMGG
jgi:hypothetical protein